MGNKNDSSTSVPQQAQEASDSQRDINRSEHAENERSKMTYEQLAERRSTPRSQTPFYKVMLALNIVGWVGMVVVLVLFHYARPDFISGVQQYWGIKGDTTWSESHLSAMTIMLQVCLIVTLVSIIMRARRNRRRSDSFGINLFILLAIAGISLITLATTLGL
jgi:cation transport ATPase